MALAEASGNQKLARLIGQLLDEMERSDKATGLATLCVASGMGSATIVERV